MEWIIIIILVGFVLFWVWNFFIKRDFVHIFERGNVLVSGLRGAGKDLAFCIVVNARKENYISNVQYSDPHKKYQCFPLDIKVWNLAKNDYKKLVSGKPNRYNYPYPDNIDYYVSDMGIYFPAQFASDLAREYQSETMFQALSRHLGDCNVHGNSQNMERIWDKVREQSDLYLRMHRSRVYNWFLLPFIGRKKKVCHVKGYLYEKSETAVTGLIPPHFGFGPRGLDRRIHWEEAHGKVKKYSFWTVLPYAYDSRRFKRILENGCVDFEK